MKAAFRSKYGPPKVLSIKELVENGSFKPVIDRIYTLDKIAEAFTYVATGQKIGNVVVTMV